MSPLERRYRRLLWLLPPDHRAGRGEELLGLLLDLDEGRRRPSLRQAAGLVGLGLRLRLVRAGSVLLVAFLIAEPSQLAAVAYRAATGRATYSTTLPYNNVYVLLIVPALMWLASAVVWLYRGPRAALLVFGAYLVLQLYRAGLYGVTRLDVVALVLLGVAALGRWPVPRARLAMPYWRASPPQTPLRRAPAVSDGPATPPQTPLRRAPAMLVGIPLAMALWVLSAMAPLHGPLWALVLPGITIAVALVGIAPDRPALARG